MKGHGKLSHLPKLPWLSPNILNMKTSVSLSLKGDHSHEIKRHLLLGRNVKTNLDSMLKSRDIALPTKVHLVKAMVFPVVMYGVRVGLQRKLSAKELMLLNCGVGEDS